MSDIAIKVENVSKQYRLGEIGTGSLSRDLERWWYKIRGKEDPFLKIGESHEPNLQGESDYIWALKDINFEVKKGEVLGIIGRNGAGKSTLLKILSSTTTPTTGQIKIQGKIASLLEVGTGFHPDLTGRDNIYLNGAILGMNRREIKSKFDEIVDFAGVERYIDTPVKRYSSGMYVRLAFGVAAHLEPDILIVDEVLAVGDSEFQKKCLGKMKEVSVNDGRTVLFVSHQMGSIAQLCKNGLVLKNGRVQMLGSVKDAITEYLKPNKEKLDNGYFSLNPKNKKTYFKRIVTTNNKSEENEIFGFDEEIVLMTEFEIDKIEKNVLLSITIQDKFGHLISTGILDIDEFSNQKCLNKILIKLPSKVFAPNIYSFRFGLFKPNVITYDLLEEVCQIKIIDSGSKMASFEGLDYGNIIMDVKFENIPNEY